MSILEFDIAALIISLIVLVNYERKKHVRDGLSAIFVTMTIITIVLPILDVLYEAGAYFQFSRGTMMGLLTLYYIGMETIALCLFLYLFGQLRLRDNLTLPFQIALSLPHFFGVAILIANQWTCQMFNYTEDGLERTLFSLFIYVAPALYLGISVGYALIHRHELKLVYKVLVYFFSGINLFAIIVQLLTDDLLIHCFTLSICILILFLNAYKDRNLLDNWTGLVNKVHLPDRIKKLIHNKIPFSLIMVRIADYSMLSSNYGVDNTELLIAQIAEFVQSFVPVGDAYQINNNCFGIIVKHKRKTDTAELQEKLYEGIDRVWNVNSMEMVCTCFISEVAYPLHCEDEKSFRSYMLYFQKMRHKRYGIISATEFGLKDKVRERQVELAMTRAMKNRSFEVHYQPICTTADQNFVSAEALVRLKDQQLGYIPPMEFIPMAEENGTIIAIGNIMLEKVCQFIASHDLEAMGISYIEVNLSTIQCLQRTFIPDLERLMEKYQIDYRKLCFEITETASNCEPKIFTENLRKLREMGFLLALDDFGTGYANLQRLITTEFDLIKFDKYMIQTTWDKEEFHETFQKLLKMFHSLGFHIVAEGVENLEQYNFLKEVGCDYIQGYYFSRPLPEDEFVDFVERHN